MVKRWSFTPDEIKEIYRKRKGVNKGIERTDEVKDKISKNLKGRVITQEWRDKISKAKIEFFKRKKLNSNI